MQRVFATDKKDELESKIDDLFKVLIAAESDAGNLCNLSIELSPNACEGRCLISGHDFEPGSILIEIPKQFLINYRFVLNDPKMRPFFNWYSNLSAVSKSYSLSRWDALLLLLIHSKHNNESSFLHKFTMTLPKQFDTPEYFDPRLVDLMPIHVKREVKSRLADLDEKYERIKSLLDAYSESNGTRFMIDYFTKEEFRWAFCSMNSRVFYMEEVDICTKEEIQLGKAYFGDLDQMSVEIDKMSIDNIKDYKQKSKKNYELRNNYCCMAPLIDFANHSDSPSASGRFEQSSQSYRLCAIEELKRGEQVSITYGYHDNESLLIEYGFVMDVNAFDKLVFRFDDIEPILASIADQNRRDEAIREKLLEDLSCNSFTGPSWTFLRFLDIIARLRNSDTDLSQLEDADVENYEDIRLMFVDLLKTYESYCEKSRLDLENYRKNNLTDHVDLVLKLIKCHLDIIRFNLDLAGDKSKWMELF